MIKYSFRQDKQTNKKQLRIYCTELQIINSEDLNITMDARASFQNILEQITTSNLNFKLELSPFSANICLKKSFIKNKSGQILKPAPIDDNLQSENRTLCQKLHQLELSYQFLQHNYTVALNYSEETQKVNHQLKTELDRLQLVVNKEDTAEAFNVKDESVQNELAILENKVKDISDQNRSYKTEVKHISAKHEKVTSEVKALKSDKENLEKEIKKLSIALKCVKKESNENCKRNDDDRKVLEKEILHLSEYKQKHENESREFKRQQKQMMKKERKASKKAAELEVKKMKNDREAFNVDLNKNTNLEREATNNNTNPNKSSSSSSLIDILPDENFSHLNLSSNLVPTSSLVTTSSMDPACSLETTTSLHPTSSSLVTTSGLDTTVNTSSMDPACSLENTTSLPPTSSSLVTTSGLDTPVTTSSSLDSTFNVDPTNYDEEREMLKALIKKVEEMNRNFLFK